MAALSAADVRRRLGPPCEIDDWPLVSIVVLNRDGAGMLQRLLAGLVEHTDYPRLELIVVDNGSSDGSIDFLRRVEAPFPISILANPHNESFSHANNQGAELAGGELLLLLNNDVEPFEAGWLRELVACLRRSQAGAVAATLFDPAKDSDETGPRVESGPVWLRTRGDEVTLDRNFLSPDHNFDRRPLFGETFGKDVESCVAVAACLLVERQMFVAVGGFTSGYFYGGEDEDLCLKLRERGLRVLYSGRSILRHDRSSTAASMHEQEAGRLRLANLELFAAHWGPRMLREYRLDLLERTGIWAAPDQPPPRDMPSREKILSLSVCLIADAPGEEEDRGLAALEAELTERGQYFLTFRDSPITNVNRFNRLLFDVNIYLQSADRYVLRPNRLNVLWAVSEIDSVGACEARSYDLVVTADPETAARLRRACDPLAVRLLDRSNPAACLFAVVEERFDELGLRRRIEADTASPPAPVNRIGY